ncbi:shikimate kinase [Tautonia plasticadhaerens]|uniref:Shikimate kinase n=1 Tax=Tautonia plasticadhaerens TaxID=2527974 RepID=A0A518GZA0_9BACT|nr:shikimate kinase [Tautonia plasticadhaerens]QDV33893.1 Shikimate kinase 2 [Tautonia plasticadhaerens]
MGIGSARGLGVALVGYRGTGKSTVGRIVADRLGWAFEDADEVLERRVGRPIASIFSERGEPAFRDLEAGTLRELTARSRLVIATGGGVVLREENREVLRAFGFVAWLSARPGTIVDRLRADPAGRPALTAAGLLGEVAEVLGRREALYRELAGAEVDTEGRSPGQVAEAVLAALPGSYREGP